MRIWSFLDPLFQSLRNLLGVRGVCIYPVSCGHYAKHMLINKPFYIAIPLIVVRVLSCNPIMAIIRRCRN